MDEISLLEYWEMISRKWKLIAVITVAAVFLAVVYLLVTPVSYEATTTLIFPPQQNSGSSFLAQLSGVQSLLGGSVSLAPNTYAQIVKSRKVSHSVGKKLDLGKYGVDLDQPENFIRTNIPKEGGFAVTATVPTSWFKDMGKSKARKLAAGMAAAVANAYVEELQQYEQTTALTNGRKNRIFIESELEKTQKRLAEAEDKFKVFREKNPAVIPVEHAEATFTHLVDVRTKQLEASAGYNETNRRLESATQVLAKEDRELLSSRVLSDNPVMLDLRSKLADLEIKRATLLENVTEKHPDIVGIDQEIAKVRETMATSIKDRVTSSQTLSMNPVYQDIEGQIVALVVETAGLKAREDALASVMAKMEQNMTKMAAKQLEYIRLGRDVRALETVYTTLLGEYSKAQINEAKETENFQVLDWAQAPKFASKPRPKLTIAATLVLGLCFGSFIAIIQGSSARARKNKKIRRMKPRPPKVGVIKSAAPSNGERD